MTFFAERLIRRPDIHSIPVGERGAGGIPLPPPKEQPEEQDEKEDNGKKEKGR